MKYLIFYFAIFLMSSPQALARFYDPGIGDPYRNKKTIIHYNIPKPTVNVPKVKPMVYKVNQRKMYEFARKARAMKLPPEREFTFKRGHKILESYQEFMNPTTHAKLYERKKLTLAKVKKAPKDPELDKIAWAEKRINALLDIYLGEHRIPATSLWRLATEKRIPRIQRQKDALFAGLAAHAHGWQNTAMMAYRYALDLGLGKNKKLKKQSKEDQSYYQYVLLKLASELESDYAVSRIIQSINSRAIAQMPTDKDLDRIFFHLGKLRFGTDDKVLNLLETKLSEESEYREKIRLLRALSYIENRHHKDAFKLLKDLAKSENEEIHMQARVNLARLFAIFSQYEEALEIYRTLPMESLTRLDTLLEIAWLEFENNEYQYSLGKTIGLQTKFFYHAFLPEIYILEAYNRKNMCDFGGAEQALAEFKQDYTREINELRELVRNKKRNPSFSMYSQIKDAYRDQDKNRIRRFERYLLQMPAIANKQIELHGIQQEHNMLSTETLAQVLTDDAQYMQDRKWMLGSLHKYYKNARATALPQIERTIYEELKFIDRKLLALFQQIEFIQLDIAAQADANHTLQAALNYPAPPEEKKPEIPMTINRWEFADNEYWEDEIGWLRVRNPSKCVPNSHENPENSLAGL